jgi:8-oxo-dGTP diphosphatase
MATYRHSVSVAAAVVDEADRVLVIRRRDNGSWEPPGGVLEADETIADGLVREVLEETGLHIEPEVLTGVYKNMVLGIVALVFRCRLLSGTAAASTEALEVSWLTADQLREHMREAYAIRMLDALDPGPPAVRAHDGRSLVTPS